MVVIAAGLSGLAQAVHLMGGATGAGASDPAVQAVASGGGVQPAVVRFGVGAWPAVAAAIAAHLLVLLAEHRPIAEAMLDVQSGRVEADARALDDGADQLALAATVSASDTRPSEAAQEEISSGGAAVVVRPNDSAIDRARDAARAHHLREGSWPTARRLADLAGVSRSTAAAAVKGLKTDAGRKVPGGARSDSGARRADP